MNSKNILKESENIFKGELMKKKINAEKINSISFTTKNQWKFKEGIL